MHAGMVSRVFLVFFRGVFLGPLSRLDRSCGFLDHLSDVSLTAYADFFFFSM